MIQFNETLAVMRNGFEHHVRAIVSAEAIFMAADADIEVGDHMFRALPSGRMEEMVATKVVVLRSPFEGSRDMDSTTVNYEQAAAHAAAAAARNQTFTFNATNMQVATGDHANQQMTVGQAAEQVAAAIAGLIEILAALGVDFDTANAHQLQEDAQLEVQQPGSKPGAVARLRDWAIECVKKGGTTATVGAVTLLSNDLVDQARQIAESSL